MLRVEGSLLLRQARVEANRDSDQGHRRGDQRGGVQGQREALRTISSADRELTHSQAVSTGE
jgi:hypothetical protein